VSLCGNNWEQRQLHSSIECIPHTRARTLRSITLCFCRFAALKASFLLRGRRSTWWWLAWLLWLQRRVAVINQWCLLLRIATVVLHHKWHLRTQLSQFKEIYQGLPSPVPGTSQSLPLSSSKKPVIISFSKLTFFRSTIFFRKFKFLNTS
jgi:hypothetical protein